MIRLRDLLNEVENRTDVTNLAKDFMESTSYNTSHDCKRSTYEFVKWVKANKERFVKEYGPKKGMEVLYATAWKRHGKSESGTSTATETDYVGPGAAGWTTGRHDVGTL